MLLYVSIHYSNCSCWGQQGLESSKEVGISVLNDVLVMPGLAMANRTSVKVAVWGFKANSFLTRCLVSGEENEVIR